MSGHSLPCLRSRGRFSSRDFPLLFLTLAFAGAWTPGLSHQAKETLTERPKRKAFLSGKAQTRDGDPLTGARVELIPVRPSDLSGQRITAITGSDGAFQAAIPWEGDYVYGVSLGTLSCEGSVQPPYEQRGRTLSFTRGEQKTGLLYQVGNGGVLQGILQDEHGKRVAKGDVTLTKRVRVGEKAYRWFEVGSIQSDENGRYGFCNVPQGSYFLNFQGTLRKFGEKTTQEPLARDYVQTFYPQKIEEEASQPIQIVAGRVNKLDPVLREAATHHVQGRVVFPTGRTLLHPFVVLHHVKAGNSTYIGYHTETSSSGSFDIAGVPPGKYKIVALADSGERDSRKIPVKYEMKKEWSAAAQLEVKEQDVVAADLTLAPHGRVSGQFWDEHGGKFNGGGMVLTLVTPDGQPLLHTVEDGRELPLESAEIDSDGHFVFHELPAGKYRIGWLGQMWIKRRPTEEAAIYLAGATIAGHDVLRDGFEVKPGEDVKDVAIVVGRGAGGIEGTVLDQAAKRRGGVLILVVPPEDLKRQWHRYLSACSNPGGYVNFYGIPPGDYRIYALETPPATHYIPPWSCGALEKPRMEDLTIYEKYSTSVHVTPGDTSKIDVRLIPAQ